MNLPDLECLQQRIGHDFQARTLLETALTHSSCRSGHDPATPEDNQRLEFLGDAVLGLLAAEWLYDRHPLAREGTLSILRSRVDCERALAEVARAIDLGAFIRIGRGEATSGGRNRESTLSDALEALLGALYIDGGLEAVRLFFRRHFEPLLQRAPQAARTDNPKGLLQEQAQRHFGQTPEYALIDVRGAHHDPEFECEVRLPNGHSATGTGPSKQKAESDAARNLLAQWPQDPPRDVSPSGT